jgi:hypothetical protein
MFQFHDTFGTPVYDAVVADHAALPFNPRDVTHLPLWIAAATAADEAGYCPVYDEIATNVGGPTRQDLRDAGLLTRRFNVEVSRTVRAYADIAQTTTVTVDAANLADARELVDAGNVDIEWPGVSGYDMRYESIELDDDGDYSIERAYAA